MNIYLNIDVHLHVDNERATQPNANAEHTAQQAMPADGQHLSALSCHDMPPDGQRLSNLMAHASAMAGAERSLKTVMNYLTACRSLAAFTQTDTPLADIDAPLLQRYAHWLRQRGVCMNTASCYMRSLRALLNSTGTNTAHLFDDIYTGKARTEKRAVPQPVFAALGQLKLREGSFKALVRDTFLFCFFAQGMPFVDVAFLTRQHLADGHIVYHRRKTGQRVAVALEPCMLDIINRYERPGAHFLFPYVSHTDEQQAQADYLLALNRYNRTLKRLATMAGISHRLTSYVARHSWASTAYNNNVDLAVIAKALGHGNPQTTLTYIREIDDNRIEEANHKLLQSFDFLLPAKPPRRS